VTQGDIDRLGKVVTPENVNEFSEGKGRKLVHAASIAGRLNSL